MSVNDQALMKKRIELIDIVLDASKESQSFFRSLSDNRSSFYHLFYDGTNLKTDVVTAIPTDKVAMISSVLRVAHTISSWSSNGVFSGDGVDIDWHILRDGLKIMRDVLEEVISLEKMKELEVAETGSLKQPIIFISHATNDKKYAEAFIELFTSLGLKEEDIFCSSVPPYDVPLKKGDIYDYLRELYQERMLYVIYLLSGKYYQSATSLNEMGAGWVLRKKHNVLILPGFSFKEMEGVVSNREIFIDLNFDQTDTEIVESRLSELRDEFIKFFNLKNMNETIWKRKVKSFLKEVSNLAESVSER